MIWTVFCKYISSWRTLFWVFIVLQLCCEQKIPLHCLAQFFESAIVSLGFGSGSRKPYQCGSGSRSWTGFVVKVTFLFLFWTGNMFKIIPYIVRYKSIFGKLGDHVSSVFFVVFIAAESGYGSRRVKTLRTHADPDPKHRILPFYNGTILNWTIQCQFRFST